MKISIVIPTYNRAPLLYRVLYTLLKQQDPDYEVLVSCDDDLDKAPDTLKVCQEFINNGMPLQVFNTGLYKRGRTPGTTGEGWSNESYPYNVGIRRCTGDIIILNSGDVLSVTSTIDQHRQWHLKPENAKTILVSTVHALTMGTQAAIDTYDWKTDASVLLFDGSCWFLYSGDGKSYLPGCPYRESKRPYHFQMSLPREALVYMRGFDEDFYGYMPYGDDDMACRLRKYGLTFCWSPDPIAIHQSHAEPEAISDKRTSSLSNPKWDGESLFCARREGSIIRNAGHEWGQYPRDMATLPEQSGVVE